MNFFSTYQNYIFAFLGILAGASIAAAYLVDKIILSKKTNKHLQQEIINLQGKQGFTISVLESELEYYKQKYNQAFISKLKLIGKETPDNYKDEISKELQMFLKENGMSALLDVAIELVDDIGKQFEGVYAVLRKDPKFIENKNANT